MNCRCGQCLDELPSTCPRCGCWLIPKLPGAATRVAKFLETSVCGVSSSLP